VSEEEERTRKEMVLRDGVEREIRILGYVSVTCQFL